MLIDATKKKIDFVYNKTKKNDLQTISSFAPVMNQKQIGKSSFGAIKGYSVYQTSAFDRPKKTIILRSWTTPIFKGKGKTNTLPRLRLVFSTLHGLGTSIMRSWMLLWSLITRPGAFWK